MAVKKKKEFSTKGWKPNKELEAIFHKNGPTGVADYIEKSSNFSEKDYIDIMSGLYPGLDIGFDFGRAMRDALRGSKFNKPTINDKAVDFTYDVINLKKDWNEKNPKNKIDLDDHTGNLRHLFRHYPLSSKMLHKLVSEPKYMLEDRYSDKMVPPTQALKNDKIKPEHLYKYLTHHPEHVNDLIGHDKADERLNDMIFDNPEHLKNVSNSNIEHYLSTNLVRQEGQDSKLNISPKRAKTIVEHAHDKIFNDALFKTLDAMEPADKKDFIDRKLGIKGGEPAGLSSWRNNDDEANSQAEGWADWTNGPEHDPKFAKRISASPHLSDEQAEHVKRHGDFDSKYELYHNKHVDPKHGVEMFKMWHDNDENRGYHAEQLQDRYKKDKDDVYTLDDIDSDLVDEEDLYDDVDEGTRQSYEFTDWVDENEDKLLKEIKLDDDDYDKISEKLYDQYGNDEWTGENPNHDAVLHGLHQKLIDHMDDSNLDSIHIDEAEGHLGVPRKEWQGHALADSEGQISKDDLEEYMNDNNPKEIDYSSHDDYSIPDHPEYYERFEEAAEDYKRKKLQEDPYSIYDDYYEDYQNSDDYQEAWQQNMKEAKQEAAKEHFGELYASSHQDDRFIPEHLHAHIPNIEDIKKNRKKAIGEPSDFLDKQVPKRSYEHNYGDDQHLYELLKDYSDANGGSIDIGRMHKLMPSQGETWKKIFGNKGKISSQDIQNKLEALPKTPYAISYGKWDSNKMQNLNSQDQIVFRLDHTDESLKPLQEDPEVYNTFKKVQEVSKRSGHPTKDNTIAWARIDASDPDHWMIDEVQSDFGKTVTQYLKQNNEDNKAAHVQKIADYHKNWREALMNAVVKAAKAHGASKISTHSPESKSSHTGSETVHSVYKDSYQKVPRKMGFKPAPAQTLPISEKVREGVFNKQDTSPEELSRNHTNAWNHHKSWANVYMEMSSLFNASDSPEDKPSAAKANEMANFHTNLAEQHAARAKQYGQTHENVSVFINVPPGDSQLKEARKHMGAGTHAQHAADAGLKTPPVDFSKQSYHEGHTLNLKPNLVKAMLDIVEDLVKFELIYKNSTNPEIKKRAQVNIDLIKHMFGYEPDLSKWQNRQKAIISDLKKSPMVYDIDDVENVALSGYSNISKVIKRNKLKNGLEHRVSVDPKNEDDIVHTLHKPGIKGPVAQIHVENRFHEDTEQTEPTVSHSVVHQKHKGKGYGKLLYQQAIQHHGQLTSDESMSGRANKMWGKLGNKNVATELADYGNDPTPHRATFVGKTPIEHAFKKSQISGKHLQKLDILMKGAMKKLAPFKPEYGGDEHAAIEEWTGFGDADSSARDEIPAMSPNAKIRALHKLGKHTEVRLHPKTGERMFLLHRGMGGEEYNESHSYSDKRMNHSVYEKGTKTSWTPHIETALGFAKDHKSSSPTRIGKVVSAWVPESEIHTIPNQVLIPDINNQFRNEHEVIVNHQTPHPHANKELVNKKRFPHKDLQTKINMKGHAERERKNPKTPDDMLRDQVAREDRAMQYRNKKGIGKKETEMKTLSKGDLANKIKTGVAGLALVANVASPTSASEAKQSMTAPISQKVQQHAAKQVMPATNPNPIKDRTLSSIMDVESSGGKDLQHDAPHNKTLHGQERAYGKYGLMPLLIRETVKANPDLTKEHGNLVNLKGSDLHNYMDKHPGLGAKIASKHYDRLAKVFGHDPAKIAYAWLNGITGTKKAIKKGVDINNHWHVIKVIGAYNKRKTNGK